MIDEKLFAELVELWDSNVKLFKQQHLGFLFDKVYPLNKEDIEKIINAPNDVLIDKQYIKDHFKNFTINPQVMNVREGYSTQVDLVPDVSWELRR